MYVKIPVMQTTRFTCYKNAGYKAFCVWDVCHDCLIGELHSACETSLQEQWLCTSSSAEVPDTQKYEKRYWSDDCVGSVKSDS